MISIEFFVVLCAWMLAGGSPGPATLGIASTAMTSGRRAGLWFALGILAGSASWGIAAALGLSAIMLAHAWVFEIIRYLGAAYLGWLAIKALRRATTARTAQVGTPFSGTPRVLFTKAAAIHITNPKAILSWGSIYAIVLPPDADMAAVFATFGMLFAASTVVFLGYAMLFSTKRIVDAYAKASRVFDLAFAGFFGFASFKILTTRLA